jgi:hypothetical protein
MQEGRKTLLLQIVEIVKCCTNELSNMISLVVDVINSMLYNQFSIWETTFSR